MATKVVGRIDDNGNILLNRNKWNDSVNADVNTNLICKFDQEDNFITNFQLVEDSTLDKVKIDYENKIFYCHQIIEDSNLV